MVPVGDKMWSAAGFIVWVWDNCHTSDPHVSKEVQCVGGSYVIYMYIYMYMYTYIYTGSVGQRGTVAVHGYQYVYPPPPHVCILLLLTCVAHLLI